jgi:hypothetical protein
VKNLDYHLKYGLLYKDYKLCIPTGECRKTMLGETHTSTIVGNFGARKTLLNFQRYVYWKNMSINVGKFI